MPEHPSSKLLGMMRVGREKSRPSPSTDNPLGLTAGFIVTTPICQQHRKETVWLEKGTANNWPLQINFNTLPRRILAMKDNLNSLFSSLSTNKFYRDIQATVIQYGSKKASSVGTSFHTFGLFVPG